MAPKKPPPPAGAPEWLVTYGDMMTLLLCFFVLLFAFSKIAEPSKANQALGSIRDAFNTLRTTKNVAGGSTWWLQKPKIPPDLLERLPEAGGEVKGMEGLSIRATFVPDGVLFTFENKALFEEGGAELSELGAQAVLLVAREYLQGYYNRIEVHGHADLVAADGLAGSKWMLGFERAKSVVRVLTDAILGDIAAERICIVSFSDARVLYGIESGLGDARNRRVDILFSEQLVKQQTE